MVVLLICGGGNGAHVYSGIASSQPGCEARVLTLYAVSKVRCRLKLCYSNCGSRSKLYAAKTLCMVAR